jgi:hypothetical protein
MELFHLAKKSYCKKLDEIVKCYTNDQDTIATYTYFVENFIFENMHAFTRSLILKKHNQFIMRVKSINKKSQLCGLDFSQLLMFVDNHLRRFSLQPSYDINTKGDEVFPSVLEKVEHANSKWWQYHVFNRLTKQKEIYTGKISYMRDALEESGLDLTLYKYGSFQKVLDMMIKHKVILVWIYHNECNWFPYHIVPKGRNFKRFIKEFNSV